jgi:WhiB family transcriptional regulator, redox-sensing transcriptional regulator
MSLTSLLGRKPFTGREPDSIVRPRKTTVPRTFILHGTLVKKITKLRNILLTTTTSTITTDWRNLAECRDSEPSLFFPVGTTGPAIDQIEAAIAICSTCPVQESCLQYALETNQESGVWGGYAEDDRRRLRKRWLAERRRRAV